MWTQNNFIEGLQVQMMGMVKENRGRSQAWYVSKGEGGLRAWAYGLGWLGN